MSAYHLRNQTAQARARCGGYHDPQGAAAQACSCDAMHAGKPCPLAEPSPPTMYHRDQAEHAAELARIRAAAERAKPAQPRAPRRAPCKGAPRPAGRPPHVARP